MIHQPVDQTSVNRDHRDRLRNQERRNPGNERPQQEEIAQFSHDGAVTATISPPYRVRNGGQIIAVNIDAITAGSSASTFRVRHDGNIIGSTVTLPAGSLQTTGYIGDYRIPNRSRLQIEPVTVGSGLADVGAQIVMKG